MKIFGIIGWKNSGKTGLVERLVADLTARGLVVSTVKHAHHNFDVDQPGRDSYRHRHAGAQEVLLSSNNRWCLMHELRGAAEPTLAELLAHLSPCDLVLVEGFKYDPIDKIECHRSVTGNGLMAPNDPRILAIASDTPLDGQAVPVMDLSDTEAVSAFILNHTGLG